MRLHKDDSLDTPPAKLLADVARVVLGEFNASRAGGKVRVSWRSEWSPTRLEATGNTYAQALERLLQTEYALREGAGRLCGNG